MARKYYSKKKEEEITSETKDDPIIYGVVYNCSALNLREGPGFDFSIITVLEPGTKLRIEKDASKNINDDWVKVFNQQGVTGYCMKKFVKVR